MIQRPCLPALALIVMAVSAPAMAAPKAASRPAPKPTAPPVPYTVRKGDTLFDLGKAYLSKPGDYRHVQRANQISRPKGLKPGSTLRIDPDLLKTTPIAARLSAFSGKVEIETEGRRAPAQLGMAIQEGQRVVTGPGAFATFELEDASRVTLPSNTAIRVERLRNVVMTNAPQRVFRLDEGRGTISATPNPDPNARFDVRTPVSISAVRGTEFRVSADQAASDSAARAQTMVIKGAVAVATADAEPARDLAGAVQAGYGVSVAAGAVSAPVALLPAPRLGEGGQTQGDKSVHFAVQPVTGAAAYRLQLSRDAGFVDLFAEATQPGPAADFGALENGTYFVRLTALDGGGLEGLPADYSFDRDLDVLEPGASPTAQAEGKHRKFLFRWNAAGDGQRSYRFQLFTGAESSRPVVDQPGLSEPQLTLVDLPPGTYGWRVSALRFKDGKVTEKVGPLQTLQIGR
ncbi:MAG: FecR domain-containing protein [Caulobacter sp.]|nr:FecR domain-containing protein [Caulobacter sp.]